jgi:hypothetical protein
VSEETRKNLLALAIVFVPLLVLGALVLWPAPVVGVSETELSEDVTRYYVERDSGSGVFVECAQAADHEYECTLGRRADAEAVTIETNWAGCWETRDRSGASGCITLLDVLGDRPTAASNY